MFGTVESSSKLMIEKSNYSFEQPQVAWLPIGLIFAALQQWVKELTERFNLSHKPDRNQAAYAFA
jgi:hypothetical protein